MRTGVNAGSLERDLLERYGEPCREAMVESTLNHARILEGGGCLSFAQPFSCGVRDDLMPDRLLPRRQAPVIFRIIRDCGADHTAAAAGKRLGSMQRRPHP